MGAWTSSHILYPDFFSSVGQLRQPLPRDILAKPFPLHGPWFQQQVVFTHAKILAHCPRKYAQIICPATALVCASAKRCGPSTDRSERKERCARRDSRKHVLCEFAGIRAGKSHQMKSHFFHRASERVTPSLLGANPALDRNSVGFAQSVCDNTQLFCQTANDAAPASKSPGTIGRDPLQRTTLQMNN